MIWVSSSAIERAISTAQRDIGSDRNPATRDERFQFGLDCVLDGIAARLA